MKKYEEPILEISMIVSSDIVTVSAGDTEYDDTEWWSDWWILRITAVFDQARCRFLQLRVEKQRFCIKISSIISHRAFSVQPNKTHGWGRAICLTFHFKKAPLCKGSSRQSRVRDCKSSIYLKPSLGREGGFWKTRFFKRRMSSQEAFPWEGNNDYRM